MRYALGRTMRNAVDVILAERPNWVRTGPFSFKDVEHQRVEIINGMHRLHGARDIDRMYLLPYWWEGINNRQEELFGILGGIAATSPNGMKIVYIDRAGIPDRVEDA